ncbi:hypothetical protein ZIOFF_015609 [Zingiber officinale]|uniref:[RNA-polymerase]-subunit kinase n=1 Tax=Zingiber officinale TaxID=94328 RepID=A0A8J5LTU6_ZINOF|nr:hypothetical protein ZIOFF_015609 [Zingiber officinale]
MDNVIGQGTYSSVFGAGEVDTGIIVALKEVRFNNFEPESVSIIHGDIECANLLVNNEGILEVSDFGLANTWNPDLWSVGCVLAELFLGKPLLQGRTKVEQLHKIFKLCGSPPDEFWRNSDLPHATVFKPQRLYVNCINETFECLPDGALRLLETFLSIVPNNRGSASSALSSEANCFLKLVQYFRTRSYACEPSSLPKYQPNKEIDSKDDAAVGEGVSESLAPWMHCVTLLYSLHDWFCLSYKSSVWYRDVLFTSTMKATEMYFPFTGWNENPYLRQHCSAHKCNGHGQLTGDIVAQTSIKWCYSFDDNDTVEKD